jgi:tetratricopeptide (TPR) repeat protein
MTLGRALLDQGDVGAAKIEFGEVLKSAADNILASRFLGECLEAEGDFAGALARYNQTLLLSPGDAAVEARRRAVQGHLDEASRVATVRTIGETPIPVSEADDVMEVEVGHATPGGIPPVTGRAPVTSAEEAPIPVSQVEEEFELERSYEAPVPPSEGEPFRRPVGSAGEAVFEFEETEGAAGAEASAMAPGAPDQQAEADLTSPTLAELYFSQGFPEKALEVYRSLLERDPDNERLEARAAEIENLVRRPAAVTAGTGSAEDAKAARREAIERTIVRLEHFLAATRREAR